jgi:ribosomal protein L13E
LSSKAKKGKTGAKKPPEETVKAERKDVRPAGRVPETSVVSRHGDRMITRRGKGFSAGELRGAGFPRRLAARWGVPTDIRRRSVLQTNVQSLKKWYSPPAKESAEPVRAHPSRAKKVETREKPVKKRVTRKKRAGS